MHHEEELLMPPICAADDQWCCNEEDGTLHSIGILALSEGMDHFDGDGLNRNCWCFLMVSIVFGDGNERILEEFK